ncbi:acyltransferase family protein [Marinobacterium sedimentorum]|uniref:acyltransferase family protein n=1 Tax=Marinobacterium sedimentorum TaxID=2927804 RepID=UPI0020C64502|nr:acyltransferase [Marinobacterium sedimentorum]MCP8690334.1 acyltransferase [Marinobacterium sedimentorum]
MKQRYLEFDYLRGIAILVIILGHAVVNVDRTLPLALQNLFAGGTAVFVFISGFFFHSVFYRRFEYGDFMRKKVQNVFYPFLVISLVALLPLMQIWLGKPGMTVAKFVENIYWQVNDGYILYPHWYIPFVMTLFALSPLYLLFIRASLVARLLLLLEFALMAMLVHRPLGNANVLQSLVYFTPYYLVGILYSMHFAVLNRHHRLIFAVSLLGVSLFVVLQTLVFPHLANYHKAALTFNGVDLMFWQKLFLCIVLLEFASWLTTRPEKPWLLQVSAASFALFFIHPMVLTQVHNLLLPGLKTMHPGALVNLAATLLSLLLATAGSYAVAWLVRRTWPRHSRMLIGW